MSSTSVHSVKPKVVYGITYASDKANESLKMPPEQAKEGKKEKDSLYIFDNIKAESYYKDKESNTRVGTNGKVLSGSETVARVMLNSLELNER